MYYLKNNSSNSSSKQGGFVALFLVIVLGLSAVLFTTAILPHLWMRADSAMQYSKRIQGRLSSLSCVHMVALEIEQGERWDINPAYALHNYEHAAGEGLGCTAQSFELNNNEYIISTTGTGGGQSTSKTRVMLETWVDAQNFNIISVRERFN